MRISRQVKLEPSTGTRATVLSPITKLFYLRPTHFGNQYQHLHLAPKVVEAPRSEAFYIPVSRFHAKCAHLPKGVVVMHSTEPPQLMIKILQPTQDQKSIVKAPTSSSFTSSEGLLSASVHHIPAEDWKEQMDRHRAVKCKGGQRLTNDKQSEANISELYSNYL